MMKKAHRSIDTERRHTKTSVSFIFKRDSNSFWVLDDEKNQIGEINTILPLDDEYKLEDYEIILLHNARRECTESSIYQVMVDDTRIGWIIPIVALNSKEHDYADNKHFLKYAYIAWLYLLNDCNVTMQNFEEFEVFSQYQEDISILIMDRENCKKITAFRYSDYIVSLFENGYSMHGTGNIFFDNKKRHKHIRLRRQSKDLDDIKYINELFKKQIPQEESAVSRFYIYYQIIEILIAKVFDDSFKRLLKQINTDSTDLYDKKEELNDLANERYRVNLLFHEYGKVDSQVKENLDKNCRDLLERTGGRMGASMPDVLYQVRCFLVHRMYLFDETTEKILEEIDNLFLEGLIQLIYSFKSPEN